MKAETMAAIALVNKIHEQEKHIQAEFISMLMLSYPQTVKHHQGSMLDLISPLTAAECVDMMVWIEKRTAA